MVGKCFKGSYHNAERKKKKKSGWYFRTTVCSKNRVYIIFLSCFLCQIPGVSWTAWTTPPAPQMESSSDQMCRSLPLPVRGSLVPCARCRQRAPSHKQTGKHTGWLMLLNGALLHQVCNTVSRSNNRTAVCAACALSQCKVLAFFEPSWKSSNWWSHLSQTPND